MRTPKLLLGMAVATALLLTGCSGTPESSGDGLTVVRTESFNGWVLDSAASYSTYQTHQAVFEGLLRSDPDGSSVSAGLAESWSFDEATSTWTFVLRDSAAFSDGTPVTTADVAFSAGVWAAGPNFGFSYGTIAEVVVVDDKTIQFVLFGPDANFEALLASSPSGVMPADFGGRSAEEFYAEPIGAGAFQVDAWSPSGDIELSRNEHFYGGTDTGPSTVLIHVVADENARALSFENGDADVVEYVGIAAVNRYADADLLVPPLSQVEHLSLNVTRAPFDSADARAAIASAIDYSGIVAGAFGGLAELPDGILPPNLNGYSAPSLASPATDLASAQAAVDAAGGDFDAELIYDAGSNTDELAAQIIQSNLAEVGITVTLTGLETGAFLDRAFGLDADMMLWNYGAVSPSIADPLNWILGTGVLFTGVEPTALTDVYLQFVSATDADVRAEHITEIQDMMLLDQAALPLAQFSVRHAVGSRVSGLESTPWGLYYYDTVTVN